MVFNYGNFSLVNATSECVTYNMRGCTVREQRDMNKTLDMVLDMLSCGNIIEVGDFSQHKKWNKWQDYLRKFTSYMA